MRQLIAPYTRFREALQEDRQNYRNGILESTFPLHTHIIAYFVYSTRTIKINIFRERVGAQVFPHSDFPEGRGAMP